MCQVGYSKALASHLPLVHMNRRPFLHKHLYITCDTQRNVQYSMCTDDLDHSICCFCHLLILVNSYVYWFFTKTLKLRLLRHSYIVIHSVIFVFEF